MRKFITKVAAVMLLFTVASANALAQDDSREYIKQAIDKWGECHNVAITKTNGDLAMHGDNDIAYQNVPNNLIASLKDLVAKDNYIDDIQLTEEGNWLVLYGRNGISSYGISDGLLEKLQEYNDADEVINSVTFNDKGDWIVISNDHCDASNDDIYNWLTEGISTYGQLWAACITDDACVAVYETGAKMLGNYPTDLIETLQNWKHHVMRIKISGSAWFIADDEGKNFDYNM